MEESNGETWVIVLILNNLRRRIEHKQHLTCDSQLCTHSRRVSQATKIVVHHEIIASWPGLCVWGHETALPALPGSAGFLDHPFDVFNAII